MKKRILFPIILILALVLSFAACSKNGRQIQSIEISGGAPTEVLVNETPDFSGIKILVKYNDLSTEEVSFSDIEISAVDTSRPGRAEYTITYNGVTIPASLEVKAPTVPGGTTTPVAPTLTSLTYRSGLKTSIYVDDVFDTSDLTITATYSDGSTKIVAAKDLKLSEIDPKKVGEQTLKISYESMSLDIVITVVKVVPVGIEVDASSVDTTVVEGQEPDISNLEVYLVHNNGFKYVIDKNDPQLDADNFPVYPDSNWVITYGEFSTTIKLSNTPPVVESIKVNSGYPTWVLITESYKADITATATLSNNLTKPVSGLTLSAVDTTTAGKKTVTATYTNEDGTFTDTFEIEVVTVTSVAIDTGSFNTTALVGKFDVSNLRLDIVLSNGVSIERSTGFSLTYSDDFNKDAVSEGTMTATFHGVASAPIKITIIDEDFKYVVAGVQDPDQLIQWNQYTYQNKFLDSGYGYVVGYNNPFKYVLTVQLLDPTTYLPIEGYYGYIGASEVLLDGAPVGTEYVTIDEENHTFQFKEAAKGKTFVIRTRPDNISANKINEFTKELTVTVVDAYNIHDAKELNVITNATNTLGKSGFKQVDVVDKFLSDNSIVRPETLNGVVLHNNFTLQKSDLPTEYFFKGADGNTYIWDHQSIYYRQFSAKGEFNFYGNYFTINTYNIPIVAPQGTSTEGGVATNDDDGYSSSEVFRFNITDSVFQDPNFNHENYKVNIYALGMRDNDPNIVNESMDQSKRHLLGVYAFKFAKATYNLYAVNAERYYMSLMAEYDDLTVNLNYTKFYDAWQAHINTWAFNDIDENKDTIHASHAPITININNSFVGKAGGPAIFTMTKLPDKAWNAQSKTVVNIDEKSDIFSYVAGDEAWFVAHGINSQVGLIAGINDSFPAGSSFKVQFGDDNSNTFMNLIMINMDPDYIPSMPGQDDNVSSDEEEKAVLDIDGTLTIGGATALDMEDGIREVYSDDYGMFVPIQSGYGSGYVTVIQDQSKDLPVPPPIFVSSAGGVGYSDLETFKPVTGAEVYQGDYIALYWYNIGIALGFNEGEDIDGDDVVDLGKLSAEPTPPETPWVTEAHAYN